MSLQSIVNELTRRQKEERIRYLFPKNKQHPKQVAFHLSPKRNKWALGGNRTGKTVAGAVYVVLSCLGDAARPYMEDWPGDMRLAYEPVVSAKKKAEMLYRKPFEAWVVSLSNEVQRDVAQKEILRWLPASEIDSMIMRSGTKDNLDSGTIDIIVLQNGAKIGFKSVEQGRGKFQGTSKNIIWYDEEPPKDIYEECLMRTMDVQGAMIGTMTPLQGLTFVYDDIYLNDTKPVEDQDPEIYCDQWEWDDNPYLTDEEKRRLESAFDPAQLEARKSGKFLMPGECVFDQMALMEYAEKCRPGDRFSWDGRMVSDTAGVFEIWEHPKRGHEYADASDVAEGLEHGDYSVCGVLDRTTMELVAIYHGHSDPDIFSEHIRVLDRYYDCGICAPEVNKDGIVVVRNLKEHEDINLFRSMVYDKSADEEREKLGWVTSSKTRPLVVTAAKRAIRERTVRIYWRRLIDECMNFVRHPNGKEAARNGYWDDAVMMFGILMHVHDVSEAYNDMTGAFVPGKKKKAYYDKKGNKIHPSMVEDFGDDWGEEWEE